ncbi:MAG: hypothetical protein H6737_11720 [Alphaproteobacteria bacterium]|nr:hypothetical protein [Alphaproteobacteria bacterium]
MRIRRLTDPAELATYAERFASISQERSEGVITGAVPMAYLERSRVMGVFDRSGRMVAGFTIGSEPPMRVIERFIPQDAAIDWPPGFREEDCCEAVCAWREPGFSSARMVGLVAPYGNLMTLTSGKRYMLGVAQHPSLDRYYKSLGGVCVYEGPSRDGLQTWVYLCNRRTQLAVLLGLVFVAGPQKWWAKRTKRR